MALRIDSHVHGDPAGIRGSVKKYVDECRKRGIEAVTLIEPLERCLKAKKKFGDFVIPVARVQMDACGPGEIERAIKAGAKGIKFIRPAAPYGEERYWPLYEKIEQLGSVAVFHTGYLGFREREDRPVSMEHMRAAQVERVSRRFPDMKILMAHFSNPWWEEGWKVAWSKKNVYVDLSGGTAINRSTAMWADLFAPDGKLLESFMTKLVFGSDVRYFLRNSYPFEAYIEFYEKIFERIKLNAQQREMVNRGTLLNLFGLKR